LNVVYDLMSIVIPFHRQTGIPGKVAGALFVARNIVDCIPVLHMPAGCAYHRRLIPFNLAILPHAICTNLTETDAVFGGEEKLIDALVAVYKWYHPAMIMIITGCTPDIVGDDIGECVESARKRGVECPIIVVSNVKFYSLSRGINAALIALTENLMEKAECRHDRYVNIFSLSFHGGGLNVKELESLIKEAGAAINHVYLYHNTTKDLKEFPKAKLLIADYSTQWTNFVKDHLKMDVIALHNLRVSGLKNLFDCCLVGFSGTSRLLLEIGKALNMEGEFEAIARKKEALLRNKLEKLRRKLSNMKLALPMQLYVGDVGWLALRDLGVKCDLLIMHTKSLEVEYYESELKKLIDLNLKTIEEVQGYQPELLINPSPEEVVSKSKRLGIDAVVCGYRENPVRYAAQGIKAIYTPLLNFSLKAGYVTALNVYEKFAAILTSSNPCSKPLLSLLDYEGEFRRDLSSFWSDMCKFFYEVYHVKEPLEQNY